MVTCLIEGLQKAVQRQLTIKKQKDWSRFRWKSHAFYVSPKALQKYIKLDPFSMEDLPFLHTHFISQSAPDIRHKLQRPEEGPATPQRDLLSAALNFLIIEMRNQKMNKLKGVMLNARCWQQLSRTPREISKPLRAYCTRPLKASTLSVARRDSEPNAYLDWGL